MHGAEAWSSHQTVSPDRASKSCFLCTIRQLTALLHLFLFFFLFPLFFNISTCSRVFFPLSLFFSKNMWNWKHWELICRQAKKNKNPQQKTSNKLNYFFCTCKAHRKTAGISPREPHQPRYAVVQGQHGSDGLSFVKATDGRCIPKGKGRTFPDDDGLSRPISGHEHFF